MSPEQQHAIDVIDKFFDDCPGASMMSVLEALEIDAHVFAKAQVEALKQILVSAVADPTLTETGNALTMFLTMGVALGYNYALKRIGDEFVATGRKPN